MNPATHILVPMLIVETYRRYFAKKRFSKWYVFLAGLMGSAPDYDLLYTLFFKGSFEEAYHRLITHSMLIPLLLSILGITIYLLYLKRKIRYKGWTTAYMLLFMTSIGLATHIILDGFDGLTRWFYPLGWQTIIIATSLSKFWTAIIDGILLLVWLLYDEDLLRDILRFLRIRNIKITRKK